jgi:Zn-dependent protease
MIALGRSLRWLFAVNAALFATISVRFLAEDSALFWRLVFGPNRHPQVPGGLWTAVLFVIACTFGSLAVTVIFGKAWWTLGKGTDSARAWALGASLAMVPFFFFGKASGISSVTGLLGLVIFWRREIVRAIGPQTAGAGQAKDGTNGALDWVGTTLMYGGVLLGESFWADWGRGQGLAVNQSILMDALLIELTALVSVGIHELGHALTAMALKMKVRHFLLGPLEWRLRGQKWHFRFHAGGLISMPGAVSVAPVNLENLKWRRAWVCAAGPIASLGLGLIALWATLNTKGASWEPYWQLIATVSTFSLLAFIINLIPIQPDGQFSDGARIYQLLAGSPGSHLELAFAMVSSTVVSPLRPKDLDVQIIERAASFRRIGPEALLLRLNAFTHFLDRGQTAEALRALGEAETVYAESEPVLPGDLRVIAHEAFTYANAFLRRDACAARSWWDRTATKDPTRFSADHWKAYCSLLWIENRLEEARYAWASGNALAEKNPRAGAYEYSRDCFAQLRFELDAAAA